MDYLRLCYNIGMRKLFRLFYEMFCIALFVVGGGYAIIAVADEVFSRKLKWTKEGELAEQLPLFQMIPGIMAGHAAVYLGRKVAGFAGSCVALLGVALPSVLVFTAVSMGYDAIPLENRWLVAAFGGLRAALTGVILAMVVRTWPKSVKGWRGHLGWGLSLVALFIPGMPAIAVILAAVLAGLASAWGRSLRSRSGGEGRLPYESGGQSPTFRSCAWLAPFVFLKYGAVAFGGGYVLVPMYLQDFVGPTAHYLQIPAEEFANLMALTQMTPGPIGINAATFFGYRLFGLGGALVTTACLVVPGLLVLTLALHSLEKFKDSPYVKGVMACIKPVTVALMTSALWSFAGMSLWTRTDASVSIHPFAFVLTALAAMLLLRRTMGVIRIILTCVALSVLLSLSGTP